MTTSKMTTGYMTTGKPKANAFPRAALVGTAALIVFTIVVAMMGRQGGVGITTRPVMEPIETRQLFFSDRRDGAVEIHEPGRAEPLLVLDPGTNGFVRGAMRGLARERRIRGIGAEVPFALVYWEDGSLTLEDTETGHTVDLSAFGATNYELFPRLLTMQRGAS
jgi:putative photosynthetic complex assembly protein